MRQRLVRLKRPYLHRELGRYAWHIRGLPWLPLRGFDEGLPLHRALGGGRRLGGRIPVLVCHPSPVPQSGRIVSLLAVRLPPLESVGLVHRALESPLHAPHSVQGALILRPGPSLLSPPRKPGEPFRTTASQTRLFLENSSAERTAPGGQCHRQRRASFESRDGDAVYLGAGCAVGIPGAGRPAGPRILPCSAQGPLGRNHVRECAVGIDRAGGTNVPVFVGRGGSCRQERLGCIVPRSVDRIDVADCGDRGLELALLHGRRDSYGERSPLRQLVHSGDARRHHQAFSEPGSLQRGRSLRRPLPLFVQGEFVAVVAPLGLLAHY